MASREINIPEILEIRSAMIFTVLERIISFKNVQTTMGEWLLVKLKKSIEFFKI